MSDSSEDDIPLDLRADDESDDEQPRKRQRTSKILRGRGLGFVQSTEDDDDDERPSFGTFQNAFNIGEFQEQTRTTPQRKSPPTVIRPSAFTSTGKPVMSSFAARQMAKMGFVEGQGLGAKGEGISAPIQAIGTSGRAGLGMGNQAPRENVEKPRSQTSTPGNRTPIPRKPKTKYRTVADIEAQGLTVPTTLKSIIIDATGVETKSVSSPGGFATPRSESPDIEISKIAARAKLGLEAYAASWDVEMYNESNLEDEDAALIKEIELLEDEISQQQELLASVENAMLDPDLTSRIHSIRRLQQSWPDIDFSDIAVALIEISFKHRMIEWDPQSSDPLVELLLSIQTQLLLDQTNTSFQSLLHQDWFPRICDFINQWDVYDSQAAVRLLSEWKPLLSPWLFGKVIDLIIPKLTSALREFRKKKNNTPLAEWIPEWLALLGQEPYLASSLADLKSHVKNVLDSKSWEEWKPIFGKEKRANPVQTVQTAQKTLEPEITYREIVEEWAAESGLLFQTLRISNSKGHPLYRLRPEEGKSLGVVIYLQEDTIYDENGQEHALDEQLIQRANR